MALMTEDDILAGCSGKESFISHAMAERVAKRRRRSNKDKFERQVAYKCRACRGWHIGARTRGSRK